MKAASPTRAPLNWTYQLAAATLAAAVLSLSACSDSPFEPSIPSDHGELVFEVDASGTPVSRVLVQVGAADIEPAMVTRLELAADGTARGAMVVPQGSARTVIARGFELAGGSGERFTVQLVEVYRKAIILDVAGGSRQKIAMVLAADLGAGSGGGAGGEAEELETD